MLWGKAQTKEWASLIDQDLSKWEIYVGVPHISVQDLDAPKSENVTQGTAVGLNNDPKNIFSIIEKEDEQLLYITGEIYAGLTTKESYGDYHLKTQFKWGEKKWEPRLDQKRDNGILYHCRGEHGAFWSVWKSSLEFQVQESDCGDFIALGAVFGDVPADRKLNKKGNPYFVFNPTGKLTPLRWTEGYESGMASKNPVNEKPNGEWNTLEILCLGTTSLHVVNGKVVNVVKNARMDIGDGKTKPISSGQIQIQSEAAECFYKDMQIKSLKKFPKRYRNQAKL